MRDRHFYSGYMFKDVGSNYGQYGSFLGDYAREGTQSGWKAVGAPIMMIVSALSEGLDPLIAGAIDQPLDMPEGVFGRTRRDAGKLLKDVVTLHPIRAAADAFRLVSTNVLLDGGDALFGFHQARTRSEVQHALAM